MNTDDIILFETARQQIYSCLSKCFGLPGAHLPDTLSRLAHWVSFLDSDARKPVCQMASDLNGKQDFTDLKVEFSRLFVGPYSRQASPLGSAYMDDASTMMGESTLDVAARYRDAGLAIADTFSEAPDHVVAELEFLSFLISKEIETLRSESDEVPQAYLKRQKDFLASHLGAWIEPFSDSISRNTTSLFYQNLANTTRIVVQEDIDYLGTPGLAEQHASSHD